MDSIIYKKDKEKLIVDKTKTTTHTQQYSIDEIDNVILDLENRLNEFKEMKQKYNEVVLGQTTEE